MEKSSIGPRRAIIYTMCPGKHHISTIAGMLACQAHFATPPNDTCVLGKRLTLLSRSSRCNGGGTRLGLRSPRSKYAGGLLLHSAVRTAQSAFTEASSPLMSALGYTTEQVRAPVHKAIIAQETAQALTEIPWRDDHSWDLCSPHRLPKTSSTWPRW